MDSHFNPRTREGCDYADQAGHGAQGHFNPRTREGCDTGSLIGVEPAELISIHAPVKGATISQIKV